MNSKHTVLSAPNLPFSYSKYFQMKRSLSLSLSPASLDLSLASLSLSLLASHKEIYHWSS